MGIISQFLKEKATLVWAYWREWEGEMIKAMERNMDRADNNKKDTSCMGGCLRKEKVSVPVLP